VHILPQNIQENGLLVLTGAFAALQGTSFMIGYGAAKAAVHQLTRSLAMSDSGLPNGARVVAILPETLDTPGNRQAMPDADTSTWTPLDIVAERLLDWSNGNVDEGLYGKLIRLRTIAGETSFIAVE